MKQLQDILDQIQNDLADLQNNPEGINESTLLQFYDRVCASITDYESAAE